MKINNQFNVNAVNNYKAQMMKSTEKANGSSFADRIEISKKAKSMQVQTPFEMERAARKSDLKNKIQSGEYEVNARKVAEDMLKYYRY